MDKQKCTHEIKHSKWIERTEDIHGYIKAHWEQWTEVTVKDLDTTKYQCTQCGFIGYY